MVFVIVVGVVVVVVIVVVIIVVVVIVSFGFHHFKRTKQEGRSRLLQERGLPSSFQADSSKSLSSCGATSKLRFLKAIYGPRLAQLLDQLGQTRIALAIR